MRSDYKKELRRRKIELWALLPLGFLFIFLNWGLYRFYSFDEELPIYYSFFYFGLININVLVFLAIVFFLGRNLVKIYAESRNKRIGGSLKARLFVAFVSFAFIPTSLMFLVSIFYINSGFDRWFAGRSEKAIERASLLASDYSAEIKTNVFYIANQIVKEKKEEPVKKLSNSWLDKKVESYGVDAVEYYNFSNKEVMQSIFSQKSGFYLPTLSWELLEKKGEEQRARTLVRKTEQGEWISALVFLNENEVLLVSRILPFTLIDTINLVEASRTEIQKSKEFKIPLKSTYLFILVTMTLVVLAFGGWFSLYLAQSLSKSLFALSLATQKVRKGDFSKIRLKANMDEVTNLIDNFNGMIEELGDTRKNLNQSVREIQLRSIYINTVLNQVSSGVLSCDRSGQVTFANKRFLKILKMENYSVVGKQMEKILPQEILSLLDSFGSEPDEILVEEVDIKNQGGELIPLQVSVASLHSLEDDLNGLILTLEKVDLLRENQRVKAWKEVATRVAHEIKNPLTPVKLSAERLHRKFSEDIEDPVFAQCIQTILHHVELIKNLVNEFNQNARFPAMNLESHSFSNFISELTEDYKVSYPNLDFKIVLKDLDFFKFDQEQFKRVFINLMDNSIAAMEGQDDQCIKIEGSRSVSGKVILLKFSDSGPGVPQELWREVFKSRYSTKKGNSGLGLSIVKKIIDDHGGRISLAQGTDAKSVFLMELPLLEGAGS